VIVTLGPPSADVKRSVVLRPGEAVVLAELLLRGARKTLWN
jgi:hypothetical protein